MDLLPSLLNEKTKLVAIGAASNILGTINDIETVCALARDAGALSFVDAVHYAAHELIDVKKIECDFLACRLTSSMVRTSAYYTDEKICSNRSTLQS
jgi:selenocysteine lyase/cysteine desulfurase